MPKLKLSLYNYIDGFFDRVAKTNVTFLDFINSDTILKDYIISADYDMIYDKVYNGTPESISSTITKNILKDLINYILKGENHELRKLSNNQIQVIVHQYLTAKENVDSLKGKYYYLLKNHIAINQENKKIKKFKEDSFNDDKEFMSEDQFEEHEKEQGFLDNKLDKNEDEVDINAIEVNDDEKEEINAEVGKLTDLENHCWQYLKDRQYFHITLSYFSLDAIKQIGNRAKLKLELFKKFTFI